MHPATPTTARLSSFIIDNMEGILQAWENFARTIEPPALTMDDTELRDHAKLMLEAIALDLETPQTGRERDAKAQGRAPVTDDDTAAQTHAEARLVSGYSIEQLVSEYRALRSSVLHLWMSQMTTGMPTDMGDMTRFNEAIDQALAESVARYAKLVKQSDNMFLAILGHDLRNPLGTVISGATFIMRATDVPSKYILAATRIFNSGQRMSKLIADLIDFTRSHLGVGIPIKPKRIDLAEVCLNVVDELRTSHPERLIDFERGARVEIDGDDARLAQVLSNLLGNALQYGTPHEPIGVRLSAQDDEVRITVHNKGPVIPPKHIARVFAPLVRLAGYDDPGQAHDSSLGIGMYIARQIVTGHNGTMSVESNEADGTTFIMVLPRHVVAPRPAGEA